MKNNQQKETLEYFRKCATEWKEKANKSGVNEVNVIKQRNDYVLEVINNRKETKLALDIGCGTGDLVYEIGELEIESIGVDFSDEMINIAKKRIENVVKGKVEFECCSIFDFDFPVNKLDVVSANGLIEYISLEEMKKLFKIIFEKLNKGGSFVVGSRNRLFNIFSLNAYTEKEIDDKSIECLIREAIEIVRCENIKDLEKIKAVRFQDENMEHLKTGIEVNTRFQYTPVQLMHLLREIGFEIIEVAPIHIHGVVPKFANENKEIHGIISNMLQISSKNRMELIPYASSFMIHAIKG